jgi:hypothetical protein
MPIFEVTFKGNYEAATEKLASIQASLNRQSLVFNKIVLKGIDEVDETEGVIDVKEIPDTLKTWVELFVREDEYHLWEDINLDSAVLIRKNRVTGSVILQAVIKGVDPKEMIVLVRINGEGDEYDLIQCNPLMTGNDIGGWIKREQEIGDKK